jgi:hypothetical protein
MADDTTPAKRLLVCSCGRALAASHAGEMRRVREEMESGPIWIVYVDGRFHHVCSLV